MKIVQLRAENFKRLGVVEITPEGNVVRIGGKNGHGKSSVLDAIYVALKGRAVAPPQPIRKGEEKAVIRLDMGDLVVTRSFIEKEGRPFTDTLKVETADGLRYGTEPQKVLNALLGEVGFDPFAFVNLKPDQQAARLLEMVPLSIDLDEFRQLDVSDYAKRTEVNRDVHRLKAQVDGIPEETVPDEAPDRAALADQLAGAAETNAEIERRRVQRQSRDARIEQLNNLAKAARERAAALIKEAEGHDVEAAGLEQARDKEHPLEDPVDVTAIRTKLSEAETVLAAIDRQARRKALLAEHAAAVAQSEALTAAMEKRAKERNEALATADMPVPGLAFAINEKGDPVLTYEGLPFEKDQISTAVQLRVSTAIGMAANPRLRVLRISDGSLLDEDSMKMLSEMAETEDFQLWVEVVGDAPVGVIMENGEVKGAAVAADAEAKIDAAEAMDPAGTGGGTPAKGKAKKAEPKTGETLL